jgi:hypothetical protein
MTVSEGLNTWSLVHAVQGDGGSVRVGGGGEEQQKKKGRAGWASTHLWPTKRIQK